MILSNLHKVIIAVLILALFPVFFIPAFLGPDDLASCQVRPDPLKDGCQAGDVIVAVSGGDTSARTEEAIRLYHNGWAPKLLFSGAAQDKTGPSNAAMMYQQALGEGVPASAILVEDQSENTEENATLSADVIHQQRAQRIILVTSAYHQRRAAMEFRQQLGATAEIINHPATQDSGWGRFWWFTPIGWLTAISELLKIAFLSIRGAA